MNMVASTTRNPMDSSWFGRVEVSEMAEMVALGYGIVN